MPLYIPAGQLGAAVLQQGEQRMGGEAADGFVRVREAGEQDLRSPSAEAHVVYRFAERAAARYFNAEALILSERLRKFIDPGQGQERFVDRQGVEYPFNIYLIHQANNYSN